MVMVVGVPVFCLFWRHCRINKLCLFGYISLSCLALMAAYCPKQQMAGCLSLRPCSAQ